MPITATDTKVGTGARSRLQTKYAISPQMEYILTLNIRFTPVDDAMEPLVLVNEIHHPSLSENITLPYVSL